MCSCKNFETNQCSVLDRNVIQVNIFVKKVSMSLNFNEIINDFYCIFQYFKNHSSIYIKVFFSI